MTAPQPKIDFILRGGSQFDEQHQHASNMEYL